MAANMADEAQSWILQPDGRYLRYLPEGRDDLFNCHRFFMENPSLSGRGTAGAGDVPALRPFGSPGQAVACIRAEALA